MSNGHIQPVDIHFDDLDATGVVHNSRYAVLLERALTSYWLDLGWSPDPLQSKFDDTLLAVREFAITFHMPITTVGPIKVHFWIDHLGRTSVVYGFRVLSHDEAVVHADGKRVQVRLDAETLRPAPLSAALRTAATPLIRQQVA